MLLLVLLLLRRYLWDLTITYQLLSGTLPAAWGGNGSSLSFPQLTNL